MALISAPEHAALRTGSERVEAYNFDHFRIWHLVQDGLKTLRAEGVPPGQVAPDFALLGLDGEPFRLSDLRGRPVLLRFGSRT